MTSAIPVQYCFFFITLLLGLYQFVVLLEFITLSVLVLYSIVNYSDPKDRIVLL